MLIMKNGPNGRRNGRRIANYPTHPSFRRILNVNYQKLPRISPENKHTNDEKFSFILVTALVWRCYLGQDRSSKARHEKRIVDFNSIASTSR